MAAEQIFKDFHLPDGRKVAPSISRSPGINVDALFASGGAPMVMSAQEIEMQFLRGSDIHFSDFVLNEKTHPSRGDNDKSKGNTAQMSDQTEYRHELQLRDEQLRREIDQRQESFRAEQAIRDKAADERFAGFLAAQAERDKAWEKISDARFDRIEKDIGSIKSDTKKVADDISGIKLTMAKYLGAAIVIGAIASAILGAAAKSLIT